MSKQKVIWSSKSMKFAYQTESQPIHWPSYSECVCGVFLHDFTKYVDSKIAPKTRAIVNIYMYNASMSHCTFKSNFLCTVFLIEVFILFTTKPCSTHTKCDWSLYCFIAIGQCIGWLSVWYANFIDFEDPITICLDIVVWKFWPARWSEVSHCLENDSNRLEPVTQLSWEFSI